MTDASSIGVALPQALPSDLSYVPKPVAPRGRAFIVNTFPDNAQSFQAGSQGIFSIAGSRSGTYLDPKTLCLKFTVNYTLAGVSTDTSYIQINDTANAYIDSLALYCGSTSVELVNQYGSLANLLMNVGMSPSQKASLGRVIGAAEDGSPDGLAFSIAPSAASATYKRTFCLPLMTALATGKMIDMSEITQGFRYEVTWASETAATRKYTSNATPSTGAPTATYTITDAQLVYNMVELDAAGQAMVAASKDPANGTLYAMKSYRYTSANLTSAGELTAPCNWRLSSITALFARFRHLSTSTVYNSLQSVNPNLLNYVWRVGSVNIPQRVVTLDNTNTGVGGEAGYADAYAKLLSTMHLWSSSASGCAIGYSSGGTNRFFVREGGAVANQGIADDAAGATNGTFAIGQDTELFSNRSDVILSGMSTLAQPAFFQAVCGTAPGASVVVDLFSQFDLILQIRGGQAIVRL